MSLHGTTKNILTLINSIDWEKVEGRLAMAGFNDETDLKITQLKGYVKISHNRRQGK